MKDGKCIGQIQVLRPEQTPTGWIGLGKMGRALVRALVDRGHPTTVWNRTPGRAVGDVTHAATAAEASEVAGGRFDAHLSSNRTCEIGLQQGTGRPYESFLTALERVTR